MRAPILALVLTLSLGLAACGDDDKESETDEAPAAQAETTATETTPAAEPATDPALEKKPKTVKKSGAAPTELVKKDLIKGKGAVAKAGQTVTVQYVGVRFRDNKQFDASWDRGEPFQFQLGAGMVIQGWDEGVAGMRVGGRRELVIPADLAYGPQGAPPDIGPNETLVFVIDLTDAGTS